MKTIFLAFACLAFNLYLDAQESSTSPDVKISGGIVRGVIENGITAFKGIPYAAPPVAEYRWRPPQPVVSWSGIKIADRFGAACPQAGWPRGTGMSEISNEDCLFLNLWTPEKFSKNSKMPVMVWLHGGGFVVGNGGSGAFTGSAFANNGVVLVSINYRLGRLGFFAFPELSNEFPEEYKGNYGYMDMIAALEWVQKNISSFGGDPGNVTIFGQSAGGVAVHSLLTIPAAKGLFQKAIIQSGGGRDGVLTGRPISKENADSHYPVSAETVGINFARRYNINGTGEEALKKLRYLSAEEIVDGGNETAGENGPITYPGPILDGRLVTETAETVYKAGRQPEIPIITGSNSAELPAGFVNARSKEELYSIYPEFRNELQSAYDRNGETDFAKMLTLINTDKVWGEPARFTARTFTAQSIPAYVYLFSYVPQALQERMPLGAFHGAEVNYVFDNLSLRNGITPTAADKKVAAMLNTYWTNFAKTGNPNGTGLPEWPQFNADNNELFEFKSDGTAGTVTDDRKARLDLMEKISEKE